MDRLKIIRLVLVTIWCFGLSACKTRDSESAGLLDVMAEDDAPMGELSNFTISCSSSGGAEKPSRLVWRVRMAKVDLGRQVGDLVPMSIDLTRVSGPQNQSYPLAQALSARGVIELKGQVVIKSEAGVLTAEYETKNQPESLEPVYHGLATLKQSAAMVDAAVEVVCTVQLGE